MPRSTPSWTATSPERGPVCRWFPMMIALLLLGNLLLAEEADRVTLSEGTWMNVDLHRRTLVFDLLGDIWRLPMNGGDAEPLTAGPDWDRQPRFSPNGRTVA